MCILPCRKCINLTEEKEDTAVTSKTSIKPIRFCGPSTNTRIRVKKSTSDDCPGSSNSTGSKRPSDCPVESGRAKTKLRLLTSDSNEEKPSTPQSESSGSKEGGGQDDSKPSNSRKPACSRVIRLKRSSLGLTSVNELPTLNETKQQNPSTPP